MNWSDIFLQEKSKTYFKNILSFLDSEQDCGKTIFPVEKDIFNAFNLTSFDDLKVVILGQDPYHNYNQAHGLAFSVQKGVAIPPSLRSMYKELEQSIDGFITPNHGCLESWAKQGVFLLNTTLTVQAHQPNLHSKIGWETFTDTVIKTISDNKRNLVFIFWGGHARKKAKLIDKSKHLILESAHPSPLSSYRGFFGCNHFNLCNEYLAENNIKIIDWKII
jgi:uracil-DNA glycosylase